MGARKRGRGQRAIHSDAEDSQLKSLLNEGFSLAPAWPLTRVLELPAPKGWLCLWEVEPAHLIHWTLRNLAGREEGAPGLGWQVDLPHP